VSRSPPLKSTTEFKVTKRNVTNVEVIHDVIWDSTQIKWEPKSQTGNLKQLAAMSDQRNLNSWYFQLYDRQRSFIAAKKTLYLKIRPLIRG